MIRPEELPIGNYVTVNNPNYHVELKDVVLSVTGISPNTRKGKSTHSVSLEHIRQEENKYYETFSQFIKYIDPIPISEEWLIKFQLPKRKLRTPKLGCDYSIRNDFEVYCYIDKSGNCNFWGVNSFGCRFFIRKCDTVHDFQNIYAVLNPEEKLTIKMK